MRTSYVPAVVTEPGAEHVGVPLRRAVDVVARVVRGRGAGDETSPWDENY
jgi:hypothetical protein